ncbi:MAG: quinone-dependent dihydroorotate dehydrogenase [Trueperaceae bacterium]|nr:quinone-dependent dihydroorotate dehydrogenase [Trueperaceae bacterium]
MYERLKPWLFRLEPERAHDLTMDALALAARRPGVRLLLRLMTQQRDERLVIERLGLRFPNPVGLAAGFDKDAQVLPIWPDLGFGSVEVGTVTPQPQAGNPKPRMFRLPDDEALINRLGFNNAGADAMAARFAALDERPDVPVGINLGKSRDTPLEDAADDYKATMTRLWNDADYFVINVSSPNTPGLRALQSKRYLLDLLRDLAVCAVKNSITAPPRRPILLKIAPDMSWAELDEIIDVVSYRYVSGIIATNTTVSREGLRTPLGTSLRETGGLSGAPLAARSREVLRYLRQHLPDEFVLVSVGGIFNADDVYERLRAGASWVQLYTALVYEGPLLIKRINEGLLKRLEHDNAHTLTDIIGRDVRD